MLTIYKASAGSGKTFQLALHYLKMVLGVKNPTTGKWRLNPNLLTDAFSQAHRHILAITFTNKATEEMKTRIIASLDAVASARKEDDHKYIGLLMTEFECTFGQLQTAARHALLSLLLDFSFFNVSTIDSFFQNVLRTFARELGIQGDYNIEIQTKDAIKCALNILLDKLNADTYAKGDERVKRVRRWLDGKVSSASGKYNPFRRDAKDFNELVKEIDTIFSEDFKNVQAELFEYFDDPTNLDRFSAALDAEMLKLTKKVQAAGLKARAAVEASGQADYMVKPTRGMIDKLCDGTFSFEKPGKPLERMITGEREIGVGEYKLNKNKEPNDDYIAAIDTLSDDVQKLYGLYRTILILQGRVPRMEFIGLALNYLQEVRDRDNMLILDDTSTFISRIIGKSHVPFIYEQMGNHLFHFLIDEFQDTSRLQWKNLFPLVENSHSAGDDSLIIGDVKQAIYRFRNSDSAILGNDLENVDFPDTESRTVKGSVPEENTNYRTAHGIVKFNNTVLPLFAQEALGRYGRTDYLPERVQQMCPAETAHLTGRITLFPCARKSASEGGDESFGVAYDPKGDVLEQPVIPDEKTKIEVLINEILRQHDEEKYSWSDIALLFRWNNDMAEPVKALLEAGIPVQSSEGLLLKNASSVQLLVSLLNMIVTAGVPGQRKAERTDEGDKTGRDRPDPAVFESRYNFFLYQGGEGRTRLTPEQALEKALDFTVDATVQLSDGNLEDEKREVPKSLDGAIRKILHRHPATLVAVIEAILAAGMIPDAIVQKEKNYIAAFSDLAMEYSENYDNDLTGFLEWWGRHSETAAISSPPECDAVRVMTIHRAKGLEFKCVHLYDFDWKMIDDRDVNWLDVRPGNSLGIDLGLDIPRELYPPVMSFDNKKNALGYHGTPFADYIESQHDLMRADSMNLVYVALTRPQNELDIYFDVDSDDSDGGSGEAFTVGGVLASVLDRVAGMTNDSELCLDIPADAYNPSTHALRLDIDAPETLTPDQIEKAEEKKREKREKEEKNRAEAEKYGKGYTSVYRRDLKSLINVEAYENDSEYEDDEDDAESHSADLREASEQRKKRRSEPTLRGVDLHDILARIPYLRPGDDMEAVYDKAFGRARRVEGFDAEKREEYRQVVMSMLNNSATRRWFSPENLIDTELAYFWPRRPDDPEYDEKLSYSRRIDRLVELPDGSLEIVDYKFSQHEEKHYIQQVRDYVGAIADIYPGRPVRGYLWYVDLNIIREV